MQRRTDRASYPPRQQNSLRDSAQAIGYLPTASSCPGHCRGELATAGSGQGLQDHLEEVEAAVVSPVCSGERLRGLEKGAGGVAVTGGSQARRKASRTGAVEGRVFARLAPCRAKGQGQQHEDMSMGKTGQVRHFLGQPCTREAQGENAAPGWEEDVPAALCLLQEPVQPRAVVGN